MDTPDMPQAFEFAAITIGVMVAMLIYGGRE